jgi:hypothetical protein
MLFSLVDSIENYLIRNQRNGNAGISFRCHLVVVPKRRLPCQPTVHGLHICAWFDTKNKSIPFNYRLKSQIVNTN